MLFFLKRFLEQFGLHVQVGEHALQPPVLVLERLHLAHHGRIHAAILRATLVEARCADPMLPAKFRRPLRSRPDEAQP